MPRRHSSWAPGIDRTKSDFLWQVNGGPEKYQGGEECDVDEIVSFSIARRNHDAFSAQCDCCDQKSGMYDLTKPPLTHFDHLKYEKRCARAHVPPHEALELPEPAEWSVECDVCGCLSKAFILQERADRAALDDSTTSDEAHACKHFGQNVGEDPFVPYDDSCSDTLHVYLNAKKVSVATVFH